MFNNSTELCLSQGFDETFYGDIVSEIVEAIQDESNGPNQSAESAWNSVDTSAETVSSSNTSQVREDDSSDKKSDTCEINDESIPADRKVKRSSSLPECSGVSDGKKLRQIGIGSYFGLTKPPKQFEKTDEKRTDQQRSLLGKTNPVNAKTSKKEDDHKNPEQKKRQCPFYKKIPGTSITVDAFSYGTIPGCTQYFLSHFHYDHYGGLKKSFSHDIYCSKVTAALVQSQIKVNSKYIHSLRLNEEISIDDVKITLLDANHCPGSVMFLFKLKNGKIILHTGDFRACRQMADYPALSRVDIDTVYLDTTYCNPSYNFPTQQETIDFAVKISREAVLAEPKTLIVCGTYSVGKERVFVAIANALESKICVKADKKRILSCLDWKELDSRLTSNWKAAQVHVLPMNSINSEALQKHLDVHRQFRKVVAFKPTGWTFSRGITDVNSIKPQVSGSVSIYGIPYSEHSSFSEMEWFVKHFKPKNIIPTVNVGSPQTRNKMQRIFSEWLNSKGQTKLSLCNGN